MNMARTHLKNTFGRDTDQFQAIQEATTRTYPLRYAEEKPTQEHLKLVVSRRVYALFPHRFVVASSVECMDYTFLATPRADEKRAINATRKYF